MSGRVVVLTGASAGVGRACAREFARRGDKLGLIARGDEGLESTRTDAEELGVETISIQADVSSFEQIDRAASDIESNLGEIDVWINNAMNSVFSPVKQMTADDFQQVTDVTYKGYVHGTLAALERMLPRDRGTILQVGSALAYRAIPLQSAYCAAKHAIKGFSESLRCELLHDGSSVRLTQVNLPAINTPQFEWVKTRMRRHPQPVPPIYQPEVAAKAIYWASRHPRRQLNVGAVTSASLLANKLFPGLLDRFLAKTNYEAQQTDYPPEKGRTHNLYLPTDETEDFGAHGEFDEEAKEHSIHLWMNTHRTATVVAGSTIAGLLMKRPAGTRR